MLRRVGIAAAAFLIGYAALSVATGQRLAALGDVAQLIPPFAFAAFTLWLADRSRGQVRVFWNMSAAHGILWGSGQALWTYIDLFGQGVPVMSPTDPIFFISSIPLAAALYGRPERDRPRWLFDIVVLDLILIALFGSFVYTYFVVTIAVTDGSMEAYDANFRQLQNAKNRLLELWAMWVWRTARSAPWRRVLGIFAAGLAATFAGGVINDAVDPSGSLMTGSLADLVFMAPYAVLLVAAAALYDAKLFEPEDEAPPLSSLPMVSLIAIGLLVAIPVIDEVARRLLTVSPEVEQLRTRGAGVDDSLRRGRVARVPVEARADSRRAGLATASSSSCSAKLAAVGQLISASRTVEQPAAGRARLYGADAREPAFGARKRGCARFATTPIAPPALSATS